jgi:ectoine hydroxylase-related dioxygenase (phytanoyl-CoA dioxygenase family)
MTDWFQSFAAAQALLPSELEELRERGFVVLPQVVPAQRLKHLSQAYNSAVEGATGSDIRVGSTSTRVTDFVNRGRDFDETYTHPALLQACSLLIGAPFKLSSLHARTLRAGSRDQGLHVDVARHSVDWPLVGFILMVDEFRPDNGATRFVPGSQNRTDVLAGVVPEPLLAKEAVVPACGAAGSLLVFHGSTWHGHGTNTSTQPRRSIQGAYIPRAGHAGTPFAERMQIATRQRLSPLAQYLLAL